MAKKSNKKNKQEKQEKDEPSKVEKELLSLEKSVPDELKRKLEDMKNKLDKFKQNITEKFDKYILGIALLPPKQQEKEVKLDEKKINILVLVDDSDSKKMSKEELKAKLTAIIKDMAEKVDKNFVPDVLLLSELWQSCYDGKYEILKVISMSAPVYDLGMLSAIKIAELHKSMVLSKFEKYIVSYVLFGSLVRGEATKESDIDVAIIVDDTDVKRMSRAELKDKLRAIIISMGIEAGEMTGIRNKLNIQVYILTDFWESLKEANPVIFTILRDGIPFYDRGMFMPWKQLLKMGRIKPSSEAIDMFMAAGEQMIGRLKFKLRSMIEDIYWSTLTPTQAALMLYGIAPPTPKETIHLLDNIFVKKEKLLEKKYVEIMEKIREAYKGVEKNKEYTGKDIDELMSGSEKYLKRIKRLFEQIQAIKEKESMVQLYDNTITIIKDALKIEGIKELSEKDILKTFESELIKKGKIPDKYLTMLRKIIKSKKEYDEGKLSRVETEKIKTIGRNLIKFMTEYMQRKKFYELERVKIRIKYGKKQGEVILLGDIAFIIKDLEKEKEIKKAKIKEGKLSNIEKTTVEEMEKTISEKEKIPKVIITPETIESLKEIFGKNMEIIL